MAGVRLRYGATLQQRHAIHDLFYSGVHQELVPRCSLQVEVETVHCPYCLQEVSSSELSLFRGRCGTCSECPRCGTTLRVNTRAEGEKQQFLFFCNHCRWTSDTVGLCEERITDLFKKVFQQERQTPLDREAERLLKGLAERQHAVLRDVRASSPKNARTRNPRIGSLRDLKAGFRPARPTALALLVGEPPPCNRIPFLDFETSEESTPSATDEPVVWPVRKQVLLRCTLKHKDEVLLKPEKVSGQYEVDRCAAHYLPRCTVASGVPQFRPGEPTWIVLSLANPTFGTATIHMISAQNAKGCDAHLQAEGIRLGPHPETDDDDCSSWMPMEEQCVAGGCGSLITQWSHRVLLRLQVTPDNSLQPQKELSVVLRVDLSFQADGSDRRLLYYCTVDFPDGCLRPRPD